MSELIDTGTNRAAIRRNLLTTVSILALLPYVWCTNQAKAEDEAGRPTVWIELSGQLERMSGQEDAFVPPFLAANLGSPVLQPTTPVQAQNPVPFSFEEEGKVSFQPDHSEWVFSAALRYGRSSNFKHIHHQTYGVHYQAYKYGVPKSPLAAENFADTQVRHDQSHAIVDFSVGKDVGLGMFGRSGSSIFSLGIRFAQFASKSTFDIRARPDLQFKRFPFPAYHFTFNTAYFHNYHATGQASRGFHGIGPSLAWSGSMPFVGNRQDGELTFDWGANAAILFGKQKARVRHQETAQYEGAFYAQRGYHYVVSYPSAGGHSTVRSVIAPNVGGFMGASVHYSDVKLSLGYRADFFFGAMDGGIDAAHHENVGFYGPFASVSIGIGG